MDKLNEALEKVSLCLLGIKKEVDEDKEGVDGRVVDLARKAEGVIERFRQGKASEA